MAPQLLDPVSSLLGWRVLIEKDGAFFRRSSGRPTSYWPGPGTGDPEGATRMPFLVLELNVHRGVIVLGTIVYEVGLGLSDRERSVKTLPCRPLSVNDGLERSPFDASYVPGPGSLLALMYDTSRRARENERAGMKSVSTGIYVPGPGHSCLKLA